MPRISDISSVSREGLCISIILLLQKPGRMEWKKGEKRVEKERRKKQRAVFCGVFVFVFLVFFSL